MPFQCTCRQCGRAFDPDPYRCLTAVYCSRACKDASQVRAVTLTCRQCGRDFVVPRRLQATAKFCSIACRGAACRLTPPSAIAGADGETALIPLHGRSGVVAHARIDAAQAEWAGQWRWCRNTNGYAVRYQHGGRPKAIFMHRELLGLAYGDKREVDHIDRDRLNNTGANLRIVTRHQQMQNVGSNRGSSSRYRGVGWDKNRRKWLAYVTVGGRMHNLGRFDDEREAAEAAQAARKRLLPHAVE